MNMIEKVAIAIDAAGMKAGNGNTSLDNPETKEFVFQLARAAIEAMREPSEEMCKRGGRFIGLSPNDDHSMKLAFIDMIDAALKE